MVSGRPPCRTGRPAAKSGRPPGRRIGNPGWPPPKSGRPRGRPAPGGRPGSNWVRGRIGTGPDVAGARPGGQPGWPGGRPRGGQAAGDAFARIERRDAFFGRMLVGRIAHHCLRRLKPVREEQGREGML